MARLHDLLFFNGHFLGLKRDPFQDPWELLGFIGLIVFFLRFMVQWYATEKKKQVVVPAAFWWLSIFGSVILLAYSLYKREIVFILSYTFNCIPYFRNLVIQSRHTREHLDCPNCQTVCPPKSNYCLVCGAKLHSDVTTK